MQCVEHFEEMPNQLSPAATYDLLPSAPPDKLYAMLDLIKAEIDRSCLLDQIMAELLTYGWSRIVAELMKLSECWQMNVSLMIGEKE